ncbi:choline transporter BetT [Pontibacillus halophilus JSM 076056 = DSM 19796]|uniref:Choline transporter BetT n=1 Tax=Pontibacillus halophilus JSM 076056 = DSM 19796 TaxID=1385510 RepID=A0A0A5GI14_9BACI|nr:BCCT family transporter [Pontibacillus halophilus]KGX91644.1 choline transporter BetT [Pontibacillus halophilus JSM 076056 = DSM 19796]
MNFKIIDWPTFIGALILLLGVTIPLVLFPESGARVVDLANAFMTSNFGVLYLIMGLAVLFFLIYVAFSENGKIKLGDEHEQPEFNNFSWAGMIFCAGIGSSILYWATIEWAYYYQAPPFGIEPGTQAAIQWSSTYGLFHWGPIAWAIYSLPALPMAYFYYVRKTPILKISEATRPVIGKYADTGVGNLIDILFMFGLIGGAATTLALGTPMIAYGFSNLFGFEVTLLLKTVVLLFTTVIFAVSAFAGLNKGIKVLSDINLWLSIFLVAFIFVFGPTRFLLETTFSSFGLMLDNFFRMSTWTEPYGEMGPFAQTGFPETWTVFYWAWWLVYAPFVGLFVAKISRGRTIKQMVLGTIVYGSTGSLLFFGALGNYGLHLQLTDQFDVIGVLNNSEPAKAIIDVVATLPLSFIMVLIFTVLSIIFLATTFDSSSYILASVVQKSVEGEPLKWNRLFWAFALCLMPLVLMFLGGLKVLQTASIVGGFPLLFIMLLLAMSFMKASTMDIETAGEAEPKSIYVDYDKVKEKRKRRKWRKKKKKGPDETHVDNEKDD